MIRYSLQCAGEHGFEAWFSNSDAYDKPRKKKLVECPVCGSTDVTKHIETTHDYVGDKFADEARAMYYGETEHRPVWGEVTPDVAKDLIEEGVPAMPLPKPFAPDPPKRKSRMN